MEMKFSEAVLKGFEKVNGRQCRDTLARDKNGTPHYPWDDDPQTKPYSVCVNGAINLAETGDAMKFGRLADGVRFHRVWGVSPIELNNAGMSWEHIYGMAVAAGL
jgi:hypothetical protein